VYREARFILNITSISTPAIDPSIGTLNNSAPGEPVGVVVCGGNTGILP
jgi:hypothetical protein